MSLRRIAKTGSALMSSQGISLIAQLLLPPIFLRNYGIAAYGEWLTLTAAVVYLSTLNFGLPTFANNQVAIFHNSGRFGGSKHNPGNRPLVTAGHPRHSRFGHDACFRISHQSLAGTQD